MLTVSECERYLQRIGYAGGVTPSVQNLERLMLAHLTHVPFETVDLHRTGQLPSLEVSDLYERVVERRRGGYCFQLNKLFQELLISLGYDARAAVARSTDTPGRVDPLNHRGLIVRMQGEDWCADVGYGGPMPGGPLLLTPGEHEVRGSRFIVEGPDEGWWIVDRVDSKGDRQGLLELSTFRVNEEDFDPLNLFCASPGSEFRDQEMANLRTDEGSISLTDGRLVIRSGDQKEERQLEGAEVDDALRCLFGIRSVPE